MNGWNFHCCALGLVAWLASHTVAADTVGVTERKPLHGIAVEVGDRYMVPYLERIPGTNVTFEMIPIPGGTFLMGSPENEKGRRKDEGPQVEVNVPPMWVGKHEVTQREYREFEFLFYVFQKIHAETGVSVEPDHPDGVTAPTPLYDRGVVTEFGDGPDFPIVTISQYAAQQYTKWLSGITKRQYRLPCEAEWEYAARAGTSTAYSFGDDSINDYAWHFENPADLEMAHVGMKRSNAFGLHDMHGNVSEWTVNAYSKDGYHWIQSIEGRAVNALDTILWPKEPFPCVARGGNAQDDAIALRSAARLASDIEWRDGDPDFPPSPWWLTDSPATVVGFRLVRSYQPLDDELISRFWNHTAKSIHEDVKLKYLDGRGQIGLLSEDLLAEFDKEKQEQTMRAQKRRKLLGNRRRPKLE